MEYSRSGKSASRVNGCQAAGDWVGEKSAEGADGFLVGVRVGKLAGHFPV